MINSNNLPKLVIKNKANNGYPTKQYVYLSKPCEKHSEIRATVVLIYKFVLVSHGQPLPNDFIVVKIFKRKILMRQSYIVRLTTLNKILNWANLETELP